ncbi:MAG: serine/threonine protein kinase [Aquabacterium sp.]|uniref:serine/threonine protein kinase n=1 Tax=Aquabacterium sp. TaxID=1872578 RepID=UPI0025C3B05F|nr:serine/threonine-protein kinase [Aquabacterium sp.]MBI5927154.1 serine/threonine protein kinase [Aquabacterium sp.]
MPTIFEHEALPAGARLGEFEIRKILGVGGFGIVYLALDHALQRQVAIKEYMPGSLAGRGPDLEVVVRSAAHADTFALGLRSFINEARLLARFDHPSLVKVYRFWEEHGTAYMVMPYYQGQTLQQVRRNMSGPPDEAWLRRLMIPLLGALECLHRENVFHRDIAPDNILLLDDESGPGMGRPVLLDLGAARHVIGDHTQALTAIVKPSFAPIEQYAETVQIRQGPWTDLYALAAVVHFCITGRPPMPATARTVHDALPTLRQMSPGLASDFDCHLSEPFIGAIDHALAVRPQDRPDSVAAWREELSGIVCKPLGGAEAPDPERSPQTVLVRNAAQEAPPGHQAIEAQAYMTTIPAAGKLNGPPAWPTEATSAQSRQVLGDASVEPTVPMPLRDNTGMPEPGEAERDVAVQSNWLKWGLAVMAVLTGLALWWSQHSRPKDQPVSSPVAASSTLSKKAASLPAEPRKRALPSASAASPASTVAINKPKRSAREEQAQLRKDGGTSAAEDAGEPLSPRKACAGKNFILLAICMKRHCSRADYAAHPECERMRQQEAAQRPNY